MKLVLDTNVWLSGIFWSGEASKIIKQENIKIVITEEILSEIVTIIGRETKFQKYLLNLKLSLESLLRTILSLCILIEPRVKLEVVKADPKDNIILEAALGGKVDYVISYDHHLLNMIEFRGIKIIHPTEFLKNYS